MLNLLVRPISPDVLVGIPTFTSGIRKLFILVKFISGRLCPQTYRPPLPLGGGAIYRTAVVSMKLISLKANKLISLKADKIKKQLNKKIRF
ncbi:hypothetical protein CO177_01310 [Candidatus Wolfebacteria bacterium CG_4_9_14_3_um_filter_37_9]|uniref:Uncharacterized protein n=2 Tax=Candidatus Wolfeibacteriota TaxID=1752735 RepID=A0A2M7X617_9BACT|nr:MAG: hypothetical protein CO177_01310 [Candidatus Wolfebacteria bacterium CG_4_9_14_3_um_filter_37_9]